MRRRDFMAGLCGAAAAPLVAWAQRPRPAVIGVLHSGAASAYERAMAMFRQSLLAAGYSNQNTIIESRWANGQLDRLPGMAAELARRPVSVIFAAGGREPVLAAKAATSTIPTVFAIASDPVATGLVSSLDRPGGNVTGVNFLLVSLVAKEFEALNEVVPKSALIAVLVNESPATAAVQLKGAQEATRALGRQIRVVHAAADLDLDKVFAAAVQARAGGVVVCSDPIYFGRHEQLVHLAARYALPTVYPFREAVSAGGLMSYGADIPDAYRLAGIYVARILKGEKPADLPVQQSTKTELAINLKTAKALGLTFPLSLLGRADEVIE